MHWLRMIVYTSILALNGASALAQSQEITDTAGLEANHAEFGGILWFGSLESSNSYLHYVTNEYMNDTLVRQIVHMNVLARIRDLGTGDPVYSETGKVSQNPYALFIYRAKLTRYP